MKKSKRSTFFEDIVAATSRMRVVPSNKSSIHGTRFPVTLLEKNGWTQEQINALPEDPVTKDLILHIKK